MGIKDLEDLKKLSILKSQIDSLSVSDIVELEFPTLGPDDTLSDSLALMRKTGYQEIPVVENGSYIGMMRYGTILRKKSATPETKIKFSCSIGGCFFLDNVKINIDGTPTSIGSISGNASVEAAKVYTIDGQYVGNSTKGLKKGFYIVGGKKVLL